MRGACHLGLVVQAVSSGRSRRTVGLAAASLAGDAVLARRLRDPTRRPDALQLLIEVVDTVAWSATGDRDAPASVLLPVLANAAPHAFVSGLWAGAGDKVVPRLRNSQPFPPQTRTQWRRFATAVGAPAVAVPAAALAVQRSAGRRRSLGLWALGLGAAGAGFAFGRQRDHLQRATRAGWAQRTEATVSAETRSAQVAVATAATPGHDFKKTLLMLGVEGSLRARQAALEQQDRPRQVLAAAASGATVFEVALGLRVEPSTMGSHWPSERQAVMLEDFIDRTLVGATDHADGSLRVDFQPGVGLRCRFLGDSVLIGPDAPPPLAHLYPTALAFAGSAWFTLLNLVPEFRGLHPGAAVPLALFDVAGIARFWARPPTDYADVHHMLRIAAAKAAVGLACCASPLGRGESLGGPAFPASGLLSGTSIVLAAHWGRVPERWRLLLPSVLAGWYLTTRAHRRVTIAEALSELLVQSATPAWVWRLTDHVDEEARLLEAELWDDLMRRCAAARADAQQKELSYLEGQLAVASEELASLRRDRRDPGFLAEVERDCDEMRAWVEDQYRTLGSPAVGRNVSSTTRSETQG